MKKAQLFEKLRAWVAFALLMLVPIAFSITFYYWKEHRISRTKDHLVTAFLLWMAYEGDGAIRMISRSLIGILTGSSLIFGAGLLVRQDWARKGALLTLSTYASILMIDGLMACLLNLHDGLEAVTVAFVRSFIPVASLILAAYWIRRSVTRNFIQHH